MDKRSPVIFSWIRDMNSNSKSKKSVNHREYHKEYDLICFMKISLVGWPNKILIFIQMEVHAINWNKKQNSLSISIMEVLIQLFKYHILSRLSAWHVTLHELDNYENRLLEQLFVDLVPLVRRDTETGVKLIPARLTIESLNLRRSVT